MSRLGKNHIAFPKCIKEAMSCYLIGQSIASPGEAFKVRVEGKSWQSVQRPGHRGCDRIYAPS